MKNLVKVFEDTKDYSEDMLNSITTKHKKSD